MKNMKMKINNYIILRIDESNRNNEVNFDELFKRIKLLNSIKKKERN